MTGAARDSISDLYASFTVVGAIQTLLSAMADLDVTEDDLKVLRPPADNAMIAIPRFGLVARIGVGNAHLDRLQSELELAEWLTAAGSPPSGPRP